MRILKTTREVLAELGGYRQVAKLTKRGHTATHNWQQYGKFPPTTYVLLQQALKQRDARGDPVLWNMEKPPP